MDKVSVVESMLNKIFAYLGISPTAVVRSKDDYVDVSIKGDRLNFLIGYRGESLNALQTIVGLALSKQSGEWTRVIVDINDYRKQRAEKIEGITKNFIDRVRFFGKETEMPPMNPFERFHVHTFVSGYDDIVSESRGEKANRRVVLKPAYSKDK